MTDLSEMRRVAEAATPGPWDSDIGTGRLRRPRGVIGGDEWDTEQAGANAAHIATFDPPTVLALLDVVEAAANLEWEPGNVLVDQQAVALSRALSRLESL